MSRLGVSDHALVRFLERWRGCDIDALRGEIADSLARAAAAARSMGQGDYNARVGRLTFIVREEVVVTVPEDAEVGQRARGLKRRGHGPR